MTQGGADEKLHYPEQGSGVLAILRYEISKTN